MAGGDALPRRQKRGPAAQWQGSGRLRIAAPLPPPKLARKPAAHQEAAHPPTQPPSGTSSLPVSLLAQATQVRLGRPPSRPPQPCGPPAHPPGCPRCPSASPPPPRAAPQSAGPERSAARVQGWGARADGSKRGGGGAAGVRRGPGKRRALSLPRPSRAAQPIAKLLASPAEPSRPARPPTHLHPFQIWHHHQLAAGGGCALRHHLPRAHARRVAEHRVQEAQQHAGASRVGAGWGRRGGVRASAVVVWKEARRHA